MAKNYQVISKNELGHYLNDIDLEFPLNIIEAFGGLNVENAHKQIILCFKNTNWVNVSKPKYNWLQRKIFQRNKKAIDFLQKNGISETLISEIENIMQKWSIKFDRNEKFFELDYRIQTILNFIVISQNHKKVFIKTGGFGLGLNMVVFHFLNDFLNNGGKCILITTKHYPNIEDAFEDYREVITNYKENLKVWYL